MDGTITDPGAARLEFDPRDPTRRYLGDAGRCTNTAGVAGRVVVYTFRVPGRARFAVEVERCSPGGTLPRYSLQVTESKNSRDG